MTNHILPKIDPNALPAFEQPMARTLTTARGNQVDTVAHTTGFGNKVYVDDPASFTAPVAAHEVFHKIQQHSGAMSHLGGGGGDYNYGGIRGLQKLPSVSKLGLEQQASIPQDYMNQMAAWDKQPITPTVLNQADQLNSAYARPMRQLAGMAADTINTTPAAPGPPPAALTGMIKPLPEIGGKTLYSK